jgi:hypothetical protein
MAVASGAVKVTGLREFQAAIRRMDAKLPRELRVVLNDAGQSVVRDAKAGVPRRTGRAAGSIKMASSQREARIKAGGAKAPWYPWLDYGGSVGRGGSVKRPFISQGRYLYPAFRANRGEVLNKMEDGLVHLARSSGLGVNR